MHEGQTHRVISVNGQRGEIELEGKIIRTKQESGYLLKRALSFAPGSVTIGQQRVNDVLLVRMITDGFNVSTGKRRVDYSVELTSDRDYENCFLAVIVYYPKFLQGEGQPAPGLYLQDIGKLAAGKKRDVAVDMGIVPLIVLKNSASFLPLVFNAGKEIQSSASSESAAYFRQLELEQHIHICENFVKNNAGKDQPAKPYLTVRPLLPENVRDLPKTIRVKLSVGVDGVVNKVEVLDETPTLIREELERACGGWLFRPKLKQGSPVAAEVLVPLNL